MVCCRIARFILSTFLLLKVIFSQENHTFGHVKSVNSYYANVY